MFDQMLADYLGSCRCASRALTDMMWNQWKFSVNVWEAVWAAPPPGRKDETGPEVAGAPERLDELVKERLRKGLAPPREIYDIRNRGRIDWSKVPDWARAVDPEVFEGCGHEG
jgi:hypothetical protein